MLLDGTQSRIISSPTNDFSYLAINRFRIPHIGGSFAKLSFSDSLPTLERITMMGSHGKTQLDGVSNALTITSALQKRVDSQIEGLTNSINSVSHSVQKRVDSQLEGITNSINDINRSMQKRSNVNNQLEGILTATNNANPKLQGILNSTNDILFCLQRRVIVNVNPQLDRILNAIKDVSNSLKRYVNHPLQGILNSVNAIYSLLTTSSVDIIAVLKQIAQNTKPTIKNSNIVLVEEFMKFNPPAFEDCFVDPLEVEKWISELEKIFELVGYTDQQKVKLAGFMLKGKALHWWKVTKGTQASTWEKFRDMFYKKYFSKTLRHQKLIEFLDLTQGDMTVAEYDNKFVELLRFNPHVIADRIYIVDKFVKGLKPWIRRKVEMLKFQSYTEVVERAEIVERYSEEIEESRNPDARVCYPQRKANRSISPGMEGS